MKKVRIISEGVSSHPVACRDYEINDDFKCNPVSLTELIFNKGYGEWTFGTKKLEKAIEKRTGMIYGWTVWEE